MPLLGFGHILTLVVQPAVASIGVPIAEQISDAVEAVITSGQGLMISLPYCFLNSEVCYWQYMIQHLFQYSAHLPLCC